MLHATASCSKRFCRLTDLPHPPHLRGRQVHGVPGLGVRLRSHCRRLLRLIAWPRVGGLCGDRLGWRLGLVLGAGRAPPLLGGSLWYGSGSGILRIGHGHHGVGRFWNGLRNARNLSSRLGGGLRPRLAACLRSFGLLLIRHYPLL